MHYFCIGDADTVLGFRLAGVDGVVVENTVSAMAALARALKRHDVGVVMITEDVSILIREQVDRAIKRRDFPLVVEIPGPNGPAQSRKSIGDIVRQAVGITV